MGFWKYATDDPNYLAIVDPDGTEHAAGDVLARPEPRARDDDRRAGGEVAGQAGGRDRRPGGGGATSASGSRDRSRGG